MGERADGSVWFGRVSVGTLNWEELIPNYGNGTLGNVNGISFQQTKRYILTNELVKMNCGSNLR